MDESYKAGLSAAMRLGNLGLQYVIRSPRMFDRIRFLEAVPVDGGVYFPKRMQRDQSARKEFRRMLQRRGSVSRLQMYRKRLGMSQQELSEKSGVNLRTLQEYEVGRKDLCRAAAGTVLLLSRALWCRPSDLIT